QLSDAKRSGSAPLLFAADLLPPSVRLLHHPGGELSHSRAVTVIFSPSRSTVNSSQPLVGLLISRSCSPWPPPIAQIETVSRVGTPLRWMPFDFTWLTKRNALFGNSGRAAMTKRLARSHRPPP